MTITRRKLINVIGAAATVAPISFLSDATAAVAVPPAKKCAIIAVVDQTIPFRQVHAQFELFLSHNKALGLPFDEHMCFGLGSGDGSRKYARLIAKLCNGWIANMRRHGIEKIAVLVWSRRFGHAMTLPLLIDADVRLARTSGHSREFVSAFLRAAGKKPKGRNRIWLECCEAQTGRSCHLLIDHGFKPLFPDELPGL